MKTKLLITHRATYYHTNVRWIETPTISVRLTSTTCRVFPPTSPNTLRISALYESNDTG